MFDRVLKNHTTIPYKVEVSSLMYYNYDSKKYVPVPDTKAIIRPDTGHIYKLTQDQDTIISPIDILSVLLGKYGAEVIEDSWSASNEVEAVKNVFFVPLGRLYANTDLECISYLMVGLDYMRLEVKVGAMEDFGEGVNIAWWSPDGVIKINKSLSSYNFRSLMLSMIEDMQGLLEYRYTDYLKLTEQEVLEDEVKSFIEEYHKVHIEDMKNHTDYVTATVSDMIRRVTGMMNKYGHNAFGLLAGFATYQYHRYNTRRNTYGRITLGLAQKEINKLYERYAYSDKRGRAKH